MVKECQIIAGNFELAGRASSELKRFLKTQSHMPKSFISRVCSASYEAEINIVIHAVGGFMTYEAKDHEVKLYFYDDGPGIADIKQAMQRGYSTASPIAHMNGFGAGMGLDNIRRLSDQMIIESSPRGTRLTLIFKVGVKDE
ncbi:MAG: ATP-binding protein [Acholeplasma sp.]|nr:ATP-binding protein [Acholeplasma sp.]